MWGTRCQRVSPQELKQIAKNCRGDFGGTDPSTFLPHIRPNSRLVVITDGQIGSRQVAEFDSKLASTGVQLKSVEVYIVGSRIDLSVVCPFLRCGPYKVYVQDEKGLREVMSGYQQRVDHMIRVIQEISTLTQFEARQTELENWARLQSMGSAVRYDEAAKALCEMETKITQNIAAKKTDSATTLAEALANKDGEAADAAVNSIIREAQGHSDEWKSSVNRMRSWFMEGNTNFTIQSVAAERRDAVRTVPFPIQAVQPDVEPDPMQTFVCPVTLDDDQVPVLPCAVALPLFEAYPNLEVYRTNPLGAVNDPDFCQAVLEVFGKPLSLPAFQHMLAHGLQTHPETREPMRPMALCLGADHSHVQASDTALAVVLNGGKGCGNLNLWCVAVLYVLVHRGGEWITEIAPQILGHLRYRMRNAQSYASLSGLPSAATTIKLPLGMAFWWVIGACHQEPPGHESLRRHLFNVPIIWWVVRNLMDYPIREGNLRRAVKMRFEVWCKDKMSLVRPLWQHCKGGIFLDGPASPEAVSEAWAKLPSWLTEFMDPPSVMAMCNGKVIVRFPGYYSRWSGEPDTDDEVAICPKTCRPYYDPDWKKKATERFGTPPDGTGLNVTKGFMLYTEKYGHYPNEEQLLSYLATKNDTLPRQVFQWIGSTVTDFAFLRERDISPQEAIRRFKKSTNITTRRTMEATRLPPRVRKQHQDGM